MAFESHLDAKRRNLKAVMAPSFCPQMNAPSFSAAYIGVTQLGHWARFRPTEFRAALSYPDTDLNSEGQISVQKPSTA